MKKAAFFILVLSLCTGLMWPAEMLAADKTRALLAIENAKAGIESLIKNSADNKDYKDDIIAAQNYIKLAESEYKKGIGILGNLSEEAEPTVRHYTAMADITVKIATARLEKTNQIKERENIEKSIQNVKARIKVFDDQMDKIASLDLQVSEKNKSFEELQGENKRIKDELNGIISQKGLDFVQVQSRLAASTKAREFLADLNKLGLVTGISMDGATVVMRRSDFIKPGKKGPALAPAAEEAAKNVAVVILKYPEYIVKLKVFGFGKPPKAEDVKATEVMAKMIKELLVEKGKVNASFLDASGAGASTTLFAKDTGDANRRVEITFTYKKTSK